MWQPVDEAAEWLKQNDPLFKSKKRKRVMKYSYLSAGQMVKRQRMELSLSNLTNNQKMQAGDKRMEVDYE